MRITNFYLLRKLFYYCLKENVHVYVNIYLIKQNKKHGRFKIMALCIANILNKKPILVMKLHEVLTNL